MELAYLIILIVAFLAVGAVSVVVLLKLLAGQPPRRSALTHRR